MQEVRFNLTVRVQDIEDICFKSTEYIENHKDFSNSLKYSIFTSIATILSLISIINNHEEYTIFVISLIGTVYNFTKAIISYNKIKSLKKAISNWINTFIHFKSHNIYVNEHYIKYVRDNEETVYKYDDFDLDNCWIQPDFTFVKIKTKDEELLLPEKSFKDGEFAKFMEILKELNVLQ